RGHWWKWSINHREPKPPRKRIPASKKRRIRQRKITPARDRTITGWCDAAYWVNGLVAAAQQTQQEQEQIDEVQVEGQRTDNAEFHQLIRPLGFNAGGV